MNKAQKLLQPLIDAAREEYNKTSRGGLEYDHEDMAERALLTLEEASAALATLTDDITLADVPAVEWQFVAETESRRPHYAHGNYVLYADFDDFGTGEWDAKIKKDRRYEEIRIYLADLERKLLAELAGT